MSIAPGLPPARHAKLQLNALAYFFEGGVGYSRAINAGASGVAAYSGPRLTASVHLALQPKAWCTWNGASRACRSSRRSPTAGRRPGTTT